jgi:hypothetical protein
MLEADERCIQFENHGNLNSNAVARNELMRSAEIGFQNADKSQVAMTDSPACDRIAFA